MKIKVLALIMILAISLNGCSSVNNTKHIDEYFKLKEDFGYFVIKVYDANNNSDIVQGKSAIKDYLTDAAYEALEKEIGEYQEVNSSISDLVVSYIRKENATNSLFDKVNVSFRLINEDRSQLYAIEFIKDNSGLFNRYNVYKGIIEER